MHPVYRQIISGVLLCISLIMACKKCQRRQAYQEQQKGWSPELERQMYEMFYRQTADFPTDDETKKQYTWCCVNKIKELFPAGLSDITEKMNDSTKLAIMRAGSDCAMGIRHKMNIWNEETLKQLKLQFYLYPEIKYLPKKSKDEYVDCLSFEVKTKYPNGLGEENTAKRQAEIRKAIEKARTHCLKLVVNKLLETKGKKALPKHLDTVGAAKF
jgi:hypothetical protein